jgi:hypothetical protein
VIVSVRRLTLSTPVAVPVTVIGGTTVVPAAGVVIEVVGSPPSGWGIVVDVVGGGGAAPRAMGAARGVRGSTAAVGLSGRAVVPAEAVVSQAAATRAIRRTTVVAGSRRTRRTATEGRAGIDC